MHIKNASHIGKIEWDTESMKCMFRTIKKPLIEMDIKSQLILSMLKQRQDLIDRDPETGLWTLAGLKKQCALYQGRSVLALIHISNHSTIINVHGSKSGTALLKSVITSLQKLLPADTLLCRERPDYLLVVFPPKMSAKDLDNWRMVVESLFSPIAEVGFSETSEHIIAAGNSGIVCETITEKRLKLILSNASIAIHYARCRGNGHVAYFSSSMHEKYRKNVLIHEQLSRALEREEFHLVMQPIVNLHGNGECYEGECLVRWNNEILGNVSPKRFIALAEESGLVLTLGNWIIDNACRELAAFINRGAPVNFKLHINISPLQLFQPHFANYLLERINRYGLSPQNLCVEITEGIQINKKGFINKNITTLHAAGISVALDDFGSGYSSLSYLHTLVFDQLKIDRQFIKDIQWNSRSETVVSSIFMMSHKLNVTSIAEGIETKEMEEKLREMGCELAQGYLYGRPLPFRDWAVRGGTFILSY